MEVSNEAKSVIPLKFLRKIRGHTVYLTLKARPIKLPCEQQVLIELTINSGDFW
jgi:hypothetical protein